MKTKRSVLIAVLTAAMFIVAGRAANGYIRCDGTYTHTGGQTYRMGEARSVPSRCSNVMIISCKTMNTTYCWFVHPNYLEIFGVMGQPPSSDFDVIDTLVMRGSGI